MGREYMLCDVCHRVIWLDDAIEDGELLVCPDCVSEGEDHEDPNSASGCDLECA